MNARELNGLLWAALIAAGLAAVPARAEGLHIGSNADEQTFLHTTMISSTDPQPDARLVDEPESMPAFLQETDSGKLASGTDRSDWRDEFLDATDVAVPDEEWSMFEVIGRHVSVELAPGSADAGTLNLAIGPQYWLSDHVTLGGNLERGRPAGLSGESDTDRYSFGVRLSF